MITRRLVDGHHHLWNLSDLHYPWLTDQPRPLPYGDYSSIRKNYLVEDFRRDIGSLNVVKSVHVQAEHDSRRPVEETRWLQSVANHPGSGGFPRAIVAYVDLSRPDAPNVTEQHRQFANLRGVRQMLHFGEAQNYLESATWRRHLAHVGRCGLSFDLMIQAARLNDAFAVIAANPDMMFILNHAGCPPNQSDALSRWRTDVRRLAELPNLAVKLSGFGMFDRHWSAQSIKPIVGSIIEAFGVDRCIFGSNFPVDSMMKDYQSIWADFESCVSDCSAAEQELLFAANAERIYRI
jgi:predicted TIM-barrel fold metal-dependent hydrolase